MKSSSPYSESNLLWWAKAVTGLQGLQRLVVHAFFILVSAVLVVAGAVHCMQDSQHDLRFSNYLYICGLWAAFNVSYSLALALFEGPTLGVPTPNDGRFKQFPLFAWQCPATQQVCFCWPAVFWTMYRFATAQPVYQVPLHLIASVAGMQVREFCLFNSDPMMIMHHLMTMALSALAFHALQFAPSPDIAAVITGIAVGGMEAGSFGVGVWTMYKSGLLFAVIITLSHIITEAAGWYLIYLWGSRIHWACFWGSLPLVYMRQRYMINEVRRGTPSSSFQDFRGKEGDGSALAQKKTKEL